MVKVLLKYKGEALPIELDPSLPPQVFKVQVYTLTGVPPERQKVMGFPGGVLKDSADFEHMEIPAGKKLMLVGASEWDSKEKSADSEAAPVEVLRSPLPEVSVLPLGYMNLGSTCYLNSVLQFLRPVVPLQKALLDFEVSGSSPTSEQKLVASFKELVKKSEARETPLIPLYAVHHLREAHPQFAQKDGNGRFMQQDAEECLTELLNSFAHVLPHNVVDDLLGFTLVTKYVPDESGAESDAEAPVVLQSSEEIEKTRKLVCLVGTQLNPVNHLHEGVKLALESKVERFEEQLGREISYKQLSKMATLPQFLVVHFVRFAWKGASSASRTEAGRAKVCRKINFQLDFDVRDFCTDQLKDDLRLGRAVWVERREVDAAERNRIRSKEEKENQSAQGASATNLQGSAASAPAQPLQPAGSAVAPPMQTLQTGHYNLKSIVTHIGRSAESGHYIGWVRKNERVWYKFDDDNVTEHQWKDLDLSGGRSDYHIAFLLLYERVDLNATAEEIENARTKLPQALTRTSNEES